MSGNGGKSGAEPDAGSTRPPVDTAAPEAGAEAPLAVCMPAQKRCRADHMAVETCSADGTGWMSTEACDKGAQNGMAGVCCSATCALVPPATSCP